MNPSPAPLVRVLPADVFDALELSALVHGGIGQGSWREYAVDGAPLCALGHAYDLDDDGRYTIVNALEAVGIRPGVNDAAVRPVLDERGLDPETGRISWEEYTKLFNIVRGDV